MYSKFIELIESKKKYLLKIRDLFMYNLGVNIKGIQYKIFINVNIVSYLNFAHFILPNFLQNYLILELFMN